MTDNGRVEVFVMDTDCVVDSHLDGVKVGVGLTVDVAVMEATNEKVCERLFVELLEEVWL